MRIGEAAAKAGVSPQTIRFYERRGLLQTPKRRASGYREFVSNDLNTIRFIKQNQELGFTLEEIKQLLRLRGQRGGNAAEVRAVAQERLRLINSKISELEKMRDELRDVMKACECGDDQPLCPAVEALDVNAARR